MRYKFWALIILVIITVFGSNAASASATVPGPDLIIEMITLPPQNSLGDIVRFTAIVKNIGNEGAGMSRIDYYIDNNLIFSDIAGTVETGMSRVMTDMGDRRS